MYEFHPYFTNDGSVGLFGPDDIYHSTHGALTEAYEKFVLPAGIKPAEEIKLLDICFGIGYNTKAFLNFFWDKSGEKKYFKNLHIDAIDTDNILAHLSPFFVPFSWRRKCEIIQQEKINRLLKPVRKSKYKLHREINIILLELLKNQIDVTEILSDKKYAPYFDKYMIGLCEFYKNNGCSDTSGSKTRGFLHNIYSHEISPHDIDTLYFLGADYLVCILLAGFLNWCYITFYF
ncbi:MAG: hypothetical protein LBK53_07120 [Heliobacteriaceae bacterium]|jgi:hypothetical protein|nr:hypothetical protein [Heliobacteriaceae bacterium]